MDNLYVEYIPIDNVKPYPRNAKLHPRKQIDQIKESMEQFGNIDPIGIWHDEIVEGHGRHIAAKELGYDTIPVIRLDELTDEQRKAYALVHNKLTMNSDFDFEVLDMELGDISDIDMSAFGFDLSAIEARDREVVDDEYAVVVPDEPKAKLGDVYQLGNHRLVCGSSTDACDVKKLLGDERAKLLFTSPPYSDMREYEGGKNLDVGHISEFLKVYKDYAEIQAVNLGIQRKDHEVVQYWDDYIAKAKSCGLKLLAWNVWDKMVVGSVGQQSAMIPIRHEWIFVFGEKPVDLNLTWEKRKSSIYSNGRARKVRQADGTMRATSRGITSNAFKKMESLIKIPEKDSIESVTEQYSEKGRIRSKHPATFPVFLPAEYIIAFTDKGDAVIEPFGGSGTTLIACEQLGRACRCMEIEPKYVDVIIDRWEQFTGRKAVLLNGEAAQTD